MSAIAGILGLSCSDTTIQSIQATMQQRGPDGNGIYTHQDVTLLHSRFATVDHSGGAQPVILDHNGERYVMICDGTLFNTEQLRRELESLGHQFYGRSHGEILLHAYVQWQEKALEKCNGVFAFAVLQEEAGKVFLARDRMGVKPLFYAAHGEGFLFASQIKTILSYPTMSARLDAEGVAQLLLLGPGRIPGSGILNGIQEILPGYYAVWQNGKWSNYCYWRLRDRQHTENFHQSAEVVRELVLDAIRGQMQADVPLGTFLSGGLDSSLISAVCAREMDAKGEILDTFSLDYEDNDIYFRPEQFQPNSDTEYIRIMQNHLDTHHHWTVLSTGDLLDGMQDALLARDLPGMADVDVSLLAFCRRIRPYVKIAISGECADEVFGGYPWYRDPDLCIADGFPWAQNTQYRATFLHPRFCNQVNARDFVSDHLRGSLAQADILPGIPYSDRRMKEMMYLNLNWFMQTLLDRSDRMAMAAGLEIRVPFCDYRLVEYLYGMPWEFKDHRGREKGILRYAMADFLPEAVLCRKKSPFPKTYDPAYLDLVQSQLRQLLQQTDAPIFKIVDPQALQDLLYGDMGTPWYGQLMRKPQTIVYMLQINQWLSTYSVTIP